MWAASPYHGMGGCFCSWIPFYWENSVTAGIYFPCYIYRRLYSFPAQDIVWRPQWIDMAEYLLFRLTILLPKKGRKPKNFIPAPWSGCFALVLVTLIHMSSKAYCPGFICWLSRKIALWQQTVNVTWRKHVFRQLSAELAVVRGSWQDLLQQDFTVMSIFNTASCI